MPSIIAQMYFVSPMNKHALDFSSQQVGNEGEWASMAHPSPREIIQLSQHPAQAGLLSQSGFAGIK